MNSDQRPRVVIDRDCWVRADLFDCVREPHICTISRQPDGQSVIRFQPRQFTDKQWSNYQHHLPFIAAVGFHARRNAFDVLTTSVGIDEMMLGYMPSPWPGHLLSRVRPRHVQFDLPLAVLAGGQPDQTRHQAFLDSALRWIIENSADRVLHAFSLQGVDVKDPHRRVVSEFKMFAKSAQSPHLHDIWQMFISSANDIGFIVTLDGKFANYVRNTMKYDGGTKVLMPREFCAELNIPPIAVPTIYDRLYGLHENPLSSIL